MLRGLRFESVSTRGATDDQRVDVACFVGSCARRGDAPAPAGLVEGLRRQGWARAGDPRLSTLEHVPVPIESFTEFEALFEAGGRPGPQPTAAPAARAEEGSAADPTRGGVTPTLDSYLAAAVRAFFAQGGRRCFVVRVGDPLPTDAGRQRRFARVRELVPLEGDVVDASEGRHLLRGLGVLDALPEVSFVALPDLPDLLGERPRPPNPAELPALPEAFIECTPQRELVRDEWSATQVAAARVGSDDELWRWAAVVNRAARLLRRRRRDVQLVVALPLPSAASGLEREPLRALKDTGLLQGIGEAAPLESTAGERVGLGSAFVQLCYPWARWAGAARLPERLEPPDGLVIGALARSTLSRGTFRSVAGARLDNLIDLHPALSRAQQEAEAVAGDGYALQDRVTLLSATEAGFALLSDVTAASDPAYRPAPVNRLVSVWVRAARALGRELAFEPSSERSWAQLRRQLASVGDSLLANGALRAGDGAAYEVRCDRSTMTQRDLDSGRMVATVSFNPTTPIDRITVALALDEARNVSTAPGGAA